MSNRKVQIAAVMALAAAFATAAPANAQLGGILDQAKNRVEREAREAAETAVGKALFPLEENGAELRKMSFLMDGYAPASFDDTAMLERTETGGYRLAPGAYHFEQVSYCLKPGSYGKPGGAGYMSGKLTGKLSPYMRDILANSYARSDIPREDIQVLIWGLIAGVKIDDMKLEAQAAAAALLTPKQIAALNGPDVFVPRELSSRALRALPRPVRKSYEAHQRLRAAAARPDISFEELERIAVLDGDAPKSSDDVPKGRWSWHPDGYFIRYDSTSYRRAMTEIVVPEAATIMRDALGRITEMRFANGDYSVVTYASDEPITSRKFKRMAAFPILHAEIHSRDPVTGNVRTARIDNNGHIFISENSLRHAAQEPAFKHASLNPAALFMALWQSTPLPVISIDAINEANERREYYQERLRRLTEPPSQKDIDDFLDMGHYADGIEAAFGGPAAGYEWLIDHYERQNRALAYATVLIEGLGEDDPAEPGSGPLIWEPSEETANPARTGYAQMLGLTGRSY